VYNADLVDRLKAATPSLATAEQRVAKFCLSDPGGFSKLPVGDIAAFANVSKPTVVRFCRSLGFDGLTDFKRKLAIAADIGVPYVHPSISPEDRPASVATKLVDSALSALQTFRNGLKSSYLEAALDALVSAHAKGSLIQVYGIGSSARVAEEAANQLFRFGANTMAFTESHRQLVGATRSRPGDCVLIFSGTGKTRDVIDAADIANRNGATTIAITQDGSPLASTAKIRISSNHDENLDSYSPMVSRSQNLLVADILTTCFALRVRGEHFSQGIQEIHRNLRMKKFG